MDARTAAAGYRLARNPQLARCAAASALKVLINMLPEAGHINPTFPLASMLAARGHEVVYTSLLDREAEIVGRGFGFCALHRDHVPRGRLAELEQLVIEYEREAAWGQIRDRVCEEYFDPRGVEATIRALDPDIVLTDVVALSPLQFIAHRLALPCLQVSTSLLQRHDELPPVSSALRADAAPIELAAARWECTSVSSFDPVPYTNFISSTMDAYCARFAYPRREVTFRSTFWPALTAMPEALLCASPFDLPRRDSAPPNYLAVPVELDRREEVPAALRDFALGDSPLLFASLGSLPARYPHASRFFRAMLEAMRARPHLRAVIATGARLHAHAMFADAPPNVLLVQSAPQLWLLRRAAILITHAGLGSVREAIALGVPMIAVPQQHDQPGNAARIAHHRIGQQIEPQFITGAGLGTVIDELLQNHAQYRARLEQMYRATRAEEGENRAITLIEQLASTRPNRVAVPGVEPSPAPTACKGWLFAGALAGYTTLQAGAQLEDARGDQPVGVGTVGFTIYRDLPAALARAAGPLLARVEVMGDLLMDPVHAVGRTLRVLWVLDVGESLYDYAGWCAGRALEAEQRDEPETVAAFFALIAEFHRRRLGDTPVKALVDFSQSVFASAGRLWGRGFGAAAAAVHMQSHVAAQLACLEATIAGIRKLCPESDVRAGDARVCEQRHRELAHEFGAEFELRIQRLAGAARLTVG